MSTRTRLDAFWMTWEAEKHQLDPAARNFINDLALIVTDLVNETQGDPDAFWRLLECSRSPESGKQS